ncbi:MAG: hypothetical protein AB7P69_02325 [Candidatus Binatia bacterium]
MRQSQFAQLRRMAIVLLLGGSLVFSPGLGEAAEGRRPEIATVTMNPLFIVWHPHVDYETLMLRVSLPQGGLVLQSEFRQGEPVAFDLMDETGEGFPDGQYTYELVVTPRLAQSIKKAMANSRKMQDASQDASMVRDLQMQGFLPQEAITQTGYFTVEGGSIVLPIEEE